MRFVIFATLLALISTMTPIIASPVRVAVVSDAVNQDLAALLTTELSSDPSVSLVERDDLAKIGDEAKVQQMAGSDATALGKLANADGLLFLDQRADGTHVRFTAVNLGYALFDDLMSPDQNPDQRAKSIGHLVYGYASKLNLDPAKAIPLSILNLRADYGTPQSEVIERKLTLLLESRLTAIPEYIVLERRHAWSLGFEHLLNSAAKPLMRSAYLIDGTISIPSGTPADCTITVRVRSPDGREVSFSAKGAVNDLSGLTDQLTTGIQTSVGRAVSKPAETTVQEAQEYQREALWGWRSGVPEAALEAVDSAELLGAASENVVPLRIQILCAVADQGMENWYGHFDTMPDPVFSADVLAAKTDMILRALHDTERYRDEGMESKLGGFVPWGSSDQMRLSLKGAVVTVAFIASKTLVLLEHAQSSRADELRAALRPVIGYDPFKGHTADLPTGYQGVIVSYPDDWAQTLDEELAWYRETCVDSRPNLAIEDSSATFCARFIPTVEEREKQFDDFVESLKENPRSKRTYLILKTYEKDPAIADAAFRDYLSYLWSIRDDLFTDKNTSPLPDCFIRVSNEVRGRDRKDALFLIHAILDTKQPGPGGVNILQSFWRPEETEAADAPSIWKKENDYVRRGSAAITAKEGDPKIFFLPAMDVLMREFKEKFPEIVKIPRNTNSTTSLTVTKLWQPWEQLSNGNSTFYHDTCPDGLWCARDQEGVFKHGTLFHINLTTFVAETISVPDGIIPRRLKYTPDAVYLLYNPDQESGKNYLARYDLKTSSWETKPLPDFFDGQLFEANGSLYLFISKTLLLTETSIVRFDWATGKWNILTSSRRRPPQNQFDDAPPISDFEGIFSGLNHQPCVSLRHGVYCIREDAGPWPEVFDSGFGLDSFTVGNRTLVCKDGGEAVLLDANNTKPEYWAGSNLPHPRKTLGNGQIMLNIPTPWFAQARWNLLDSVGDFWGSHIGFHDEDLFVLNQTKFKGQFQLLCFHGADSTPRRIPLQFHLDDPARAALALLAANPKLDTPSEETLEQPNVSARGDLFVTNQGLGIRCFCGFWFLPFNDIDTYLASHSANKPASASPVTNPLDGDADFDPGDPTSFR